MSDDLSWKKLIEPNLEALTDSTHIGSVLVISLFAKGLIDDEEKDELLDLRTSNFNRATRLYCRTTKKWSNSEFEKFKEILKETGNFRALQTLTNADGSGFLVKPPNDRVNEMKLFKRQKKKESEGQYEGICLEDEKVANKIVEYARRSKKLENGNVQLADDVEKNEVISLLKQFDASLKKEQVWWNPTKLNLPSNFIPRKICRSSKFDATVQAETETLLEVIGKFVLLVDSPGMGKSTEITQLEQNLRIHYSDNRIVLRINLNEVQETLSSISRESAASLLLKLTPFLPPKTLQIPDIRIFVLLDALDEVCPTYQATMLNLLSILNFSKEPKNLQVVMTTRPEVKEAVEDAFKVESFSLLPLSPEEQNSFMESELNYSSEHLQNLRKGLSSSLLDLVGNPLMLFMLVDVLKSEETFGAFDFNLFELYSRFVEAKHKLQLVEKEGLKAKNSSTLIRVKTMWTRNLPFYYHIAWNELLRGTAADVQNNSLPSEFTDSIGIMSTEPPAAEISTELLSFGLLVERGETKRVVFKHRSFAEFFYAHLLLNPKSPQGVRDTLFGFIYGPMRVLRNVEEFVWAAVSKGDLRLQLTTKWLLIIETPNERIRVLANFVERKLFPLLAREVLTTFVEGHPHDLSRVFSLLVKKLSRGAFTKCVEWMEEEREWSRRLLLKENNEASLRLAVAIGMTFECQLLLTPEEVDGAIEAIGIDLISTLTSIEIDKGNKWEFVRESRFRELILKARSTDLGSLTFDLEAMWRLFSTFSREEIFSLVTNEETRRTDLIGISPLRVLVSLGEEFIPRHPHLVEFRGKFGEEEGKTVFELEGCDSVLGMLWEDLLKEAELRSSEAPVTITLREAIGRRGAWELLGKLEAQIRKKRSCPRDPNEAMVIEWVVLGGRLFDSLPTHPLPLLPFILRYSPSPDIVTKILKDSELKMGDRSSWEASLESLILSVHNDTFNQIHSFLQSHTHSTPSDLEPLARLLLSAKKEHLQIASPPSTFVSEVSVGQVALALLRKPLPADFPWLWIVSDVIRTTRCCDLRASLSKLKTFLPEKKLRDILLHEDILFGWQQRFSSRDGRKEDFSCGLKGLLTFYFDVFLSPAWIPEGGEAVAMNLLLKLPVELVTILEGNPNWARLLPPIQSYTATIFPLYGLKGVNELARVCVYTTEGEWERLIRIVGDEVTQPGKPTKFHISSAKAAPLLRVLIQKFGMEDTKRRVKGLWEQMKPSLNFVGDTLESKASLLHSAIQLGELEEVEGRAFPGLLLWTNSLGINALDIAKENLGDDHPITTLLKERYEVLNGEPLLNKKAKKYE